MRVVQSCNYRYLDTLNVRNASISNATRHPVGSEISGRDSDRASGPKHGLPAIESTWDLPISRQQVHRLGGLTAMRPEP